MAHSIYYDWKVYFSENPSRTQGGIYSLYDLLILEDSEGVFRVRNADSITAIYLNHDIICHNSSIYDKKTGQPNRASGTFDVWAKLGIDVAPVQIDPRALLHKKTKNGDIVIMSPASASFDMFSSYKERGNIFKDLVNKL